MLLTNTPSLFLVFVSQPLSNPPLLLNNTPSLLQNCEFLKIMRNLVFGKHSVTFCYSYQVTVFRGSLLWSNTPSLLLTFHFSQKSQKCAFDEHSVTFPWFWQPTVIRPPLAVAQHSVTFSNIVVFRSGHDVDFWQPFQHFSLLFGWPTPLLGDHAWPP